MSNRIYFNQGKVLKKGHAYHFKYIKNVLLEDQKVYMVLEDQFEIRHFIEHSPYKRYNIPQDSIITCYVDKINCTGRIILEPEHPIYKRGEVYKFEVRNIINTEDGLLFSVIDSLGNVLNLPVKMNITEDEEFPKSVLAKVVGVKKGIPELEIIYG